MQIPRAQPAHHFIRASEVVRRPRPGGRGSPPLRWVAWVDRQRWFAPPTLHQPLSRGATRRDSSPSRGAEGWDEVCGVCASVYRDANTYVSLTPVRGGVLDAPGCVIAGVGLLHPFGVADCTRFTHGAPTSAHRPTHPIPRAQPAHHLGDAPDRRRPSSGGRGVEDAAPYGGCETYAAACRVTGEPTLSVHPRRAGVEDKPLR